MSMSNVQETCNGGHGRRRRPRRVMLFPLPFQGHINPMLQLADVLHARGFAITVLHTHFNALDPARHPEFAFLPVPDGVPADIAESGDIIAIILAMNAAMEDGPSSSAVRDVLASAISDDPTMACLVIDANLLAVQKAAAQLALPTLVLRTGSAACFGVFLAYPMLHHKGYLPPKETQLHMPVSELPPLLVRDLFYSSRSNHEMLRRVLARATEAVKNSAGLMVNTFDALEAAQLERIRDELDVNVVLATGPLHKLSSTTTRSSLIDQDHSCIEWLDTQSTESVLYVSFGSLASMDRQEFLEVAWGLANSGQPFLWVVRPGLVLGDSNPSKLPDGFERQVEGRGRVIRWAPQQVVLAHHAVGGFWTHNGWNSTLESIYEGVPMICRPYFADQMMNMRYVETVWRIGFELEGELERSKIEKAIRRLMEGREGVEMRERAKELKKIAVKCLESDGSSKLAIDKLVDYILFL